MDDQRGCVFRLEGKFMRMFKSQLMFLSKELQYSPTPVSGIA
jgi:hypothetical protein